MIEEYPLETINGVYNFHLEKKMINEKKGCVFLQ
jgi:hypothetical protein